MSPRTRILGAADLRAAFDDSFAEARVPAQVTLVDLLAIRIGADPYALRLGEVCRLLTGRHTARLPGPVTELLGISGFRGEVLPVYDLAALLGLARTGDPRWMALVREPHVVALAFDGFDTHLRLRPGQLAEPPEGGGETGHVTAVVRAGGMLRPVLSVPSLVASIRRLVSPHPQEKER